jgi:hypothetical protein
LSLSSHLDCRRIQILLRGHTPIYNASPELLAAYGKTQADAA